MRLLNLCLPLALGWFGYQGANHFYFSRPANEEYKQEFKSELPSFSEHMKRNFPEYADEDKLINLSLYVDAEFKRNNDHWLDPTDNDSWKANLEEELDKAARNFYNEFRVGFKVDSVEYWDPTITNPQPVTSFLEQLSEKEDSSHGRIGITGKNVLDRYGGMAYPNIVKKGKLSMDAVVRSLHNDIFSPTLYHEIPLGNLIQHEMSHWFGALDMQFGLESIMDYENLKSTDWDLANKLRMDPRISLIKQAISLQKNLKTQPK